MNLLNTKKEIAIYWLPLHCGLAGNKEADLLTTKKATTFKTTQAFVNYKSVE